MLTADTRKRQRRQAAGALVSGLFNNNNNSGGGSTSGASVGEKAIGNTGGSSVNPKGTRKSTAQPRPSIQIPPRGIGPVYNPNRNDVLCGRGGRINAHSGNIQFRELVNSRKQDYLSDRTKKLEKAHIAAAIVRQVREMQPSGRFLKEDPDGSWYDIGDQKAIKKVGQALREDAPDIRQEIQPGGSDDEDNSVGNNNNNNIVPVMTVVPLPHPPPVSDIRSDAAAISPVRGTHTVSGRGGKTTTVTPRVAGSGGSVGVDPYQASSPTIPPLVPTNIVPSSSRAGTTKGFSGAAAAAMLDSEYMPAPPARDIAFGRQFHMADSINNEGSNISGMTGTGGAGSGTLLSGMSGVSALTDPSLLGGTSHRGGASGSLRMSQLNQIRQQWAAQHYGNSMNTDNSRMLLASQAGVGASLQGSFQQMNLYPRSHHDGAAVGNDNMSWAENSLIGGGLIGGGAGATALNHVQNCDNASVTATALNHVQNCDNASVGNFSAMQQSVATGHSLLGGQSLASFSMMSKDDSWLAGRYHHPPAVQPALQPATALYSHNNGYSDPSDRSRSTSSRSTPQQRNNNIGGSIHSGGGESVSMHSILSELSENLIALDLAGTNSLLDNL